MDKFGEFSLKWGQFMDNKGRNWPKVISMQICGLTATKGDWRNENRAETYSRRALNLRSSLYLDKGLIQMLSKVFAINYNQISVVTLIGLFVARVPWFVKAN